MGSISSVNPGLTNLLQTLSNVDSPVLGSPSVMSALQDASTADVVQLSTAAVQLENVDTMFGLPTSSSPGSADALSNLFPSLEPSAANPPASLMSALPPDTSAADQAANFQAAVQQSETDALFGSAPGTASNSLFNMIG